MDKNVIVIGGGIIGLCSAYYLQKEGCKVTVIDQSDISSGASFVNAGYNTESYYTISSTRNNYYRIENDVQSC